MTPPCPGFRFAASGLRGAGGCHCEEGNDEVISGRRLAQRTLTGSPQPRQRSDFRLEPCIDLAVIQGVDIIGWGATGALERSTPGYVFVKQVEAERNFQFATLDAKGFILFESAFQPFACFSAQVVVHLALFRVHEEVGA